MAAKLKVLAEPTRLRLLHVLLEGDATVSELALLLGMPQPRVSTHLQLLRQAGFVGVRAVGRQRVHQADAATIQPLFEVLERLGSETSAEDISEAQTEPADNRKGNIPPALKNARTCYGHLAGHIGVELLDTFKAAGWLEPLPPIAGRVEFMLTETGAENFAGRGVNLEHARASTRLFAFECADWSETRGHLGGALGVALLEALAARGVLEAGGGRAVQVDEEALARWLRS